MDHCRIVGFEYDTKKINLVAQTTEFYMALSDILSVIIVLLIFLFTEMFISSYTHRIRAT
jgi:Na+-driven multidrug efflux pump